MFLANAKWGSGENHQMDSHCLQLMREVQAELGAFQSAVRQLYGAEVAVNAGHLWLDEFAISKPQTSQSWRLVTIAAASRLATSLGFACVSQYWDLSRAEQSGDLATPRKPIICALQATNVLHK